MTNKYRIKKKKKNELNFEYGKVRNRIWYIYKSKFNFSFHLEYTLCCNLQNDFAECAFFVCVLFFLVGRLLLFVFFFFTSTNIYTCDCTFIMVSMFASSAVDRGFEPRSGKTKDYKIGTLYLVLLH